MIALTVVIVILWAASTLVLANAKTCGHRNHLWMGTCLTLGRHRRHLWVSDERLAGWESSRGRGPR